MKRTLPLLLLLPLAALAQTLCLDRDWRITPAQRPQTFPSEKALWMMGRSDLPGRGQAGKIKGFEAWPDANRISNIWAECTFILPETFDPNKSQCELEFPSIGGNLIVHINGRRLGERLGPFGFLDAGDALRAGTNILTCFATIDYTGVSQTAAQDLIRQRANSGNFRHYPRLGILVPPRLHLRPAPVALRDCWTTACWDKRELTVHHELNARQACSGLTLRVTIAETNGTPALSFSEPNLSAKPGITTISLRRIWQQVHAWDIDDGHLYCLTSELLDAAGRIIDTRRIRFGFREVGVKGRDVILNGHSLRLRPEMHWFNLNRRTFPWFRQLGLNAYYLQAHESHWFRFWYEVPDFQSERYAGLLDLCDEEGIALFLPVVTPNHLMGADESHWRQWETMCRYFMRAYRQRPSVLAWCTSMNRFNPPDSLGPKSIGIRRSVESYRSMGGDWPRKAELVKRSCDTIKQLDPSRLVYAHAEGCVGGDFGSANVYPNMTPVQEVADYPTYWSRHGDMPFFACEYGTYDGSYFKQFKKCLLTEYDAIYRGPKAYAEETDSYRAHLQEAGLKNNGYGSTAAMMARFSTAYDSLEERSQRETALSWRTYGMFAWHRFHGARYGSPTNKTIHALCAERYGQPFLGYIGGFPEHPDKTHLYCPGELVEKQLIAIWDSGRRIGPVRAAWRLSGASGGRILAQGAESFEVGRFEVVRRRIAFKAPAAGDYRLEVVFEADGRRWRDSFAIQVRESPRWVDVGSRRVVVFDPKGESQWVRRLVPGAVDYAKGLRLDPEGDVLVIGRRAVEAGGVQPLSPELVRRGLRVLYLEQEPGAWGLLGFCRNVDVGVRQAFAPVAEARGALGRFLGRVSEAELGYWRGSPSLVEEYRYTRNQLAGAPKGLSRHAIASSVFEVPFAASFRPLLVCEFDLNYSPLLEWDRGQGCVVYSSLDLTGRVGVDPGATRVAAGLLRYLVEVRPRASVAEGDLNLVVCASAEELSRRGIAHEVREVWSLPVSGELAGVLGPQLLRWRHPVRYVAITEAGAELGGAWFRKDGVCYLQLGPELLEGCFAGKGEEEQFKRCVMDLSIERLGLLVSRVKGYLGAAPSEALAELVSRSGEGGALVEIPRWTLLGPFCGIHYTHIFGKPQPGDEAARIGDINPNTDYLWKGKVLNFRTQAAPDAGGYVDVRGVLKPETRPGPEGYFAYAVAEVWSEGAREALLAMNLLGWGRFWLNGELLLDMASRGFRQQNLEWAREDPMAYRFRVSLRKGRNILSAKLMPPPHQQQTAPVGFFLKLSEPGFNLAHPFGRPLPETELYDRTHWFSEAYGYHAW